MFVLRLLFIYSCVSAIFNRTGKRKLGEDDYQ